MPMYKIIIGLLSIITMVSVTGCVTDNPFGSLLAYDATNQRLLSYNQGERPHKQLAPFRMEVNSLTTGQYSNIVDLNTGIHAGPEHPNNPLDITLDSNRDQILISGLFPTLYAFDYQTNELRIVSKDLTVGLGPRMQIINDIVLDEAQDRAIVITGSDLLSIDLVTGDRQQFPGFQGGSGPPMTALPRLIALDPVNNRLLTLSDALYAIDLSTAERSILIDNTNQVRGMALSANSSQLVLIDSAIKVFDFNTLAMQTIIASDTQTNLVTSSADNLYNGKTTLAVQLSGEVVMLSDSTAMVVGKTNQNYYLHHVNLATAQLNLHDVNRYNQIETSLEQIYLNTAGRWQQLQQIPLLLATSIQCNLDPNMACPEWAIQP